jgi:hypothetical protein
MENYLAEITSGCLLVLLLFIRVFKDYAAEKLLEPIKKWLNKQKGILTAETVASGRAINNSLIELRLKLNADRGVIFLFHNGQYFHPSIMNNSIWKFTSVYENCKDGVSCESHNMNSLLVTNHLDLTECLWNKMGEGFHKHECINCLVDCNKEKNIIIFGDVSAMAYGNTRNLFESQGIKKIVFSPIIIENHYVGFIFVGYSSGFSLGEQIIGIPNSMNPNGIKTICEYANKIGYLLSRK